MLGNRNDFSPGEVAALQGISTRTVLLAIKRGDLVASRFGPRTHRVARTDLERWVQQSKERARSAITLRGVTSP